MRPEPAPPIPGSEREPQSSVSPPKGDETFCNGYVAEVVLTLAAFFMFFSPGSAVSMYVCTVGYYQERFHSRVFFIQMMTVVYGPFPLMIILQGLFDNYFDSLYSTRITYLFRLIFSQSAMVVIVLVWMFLTNTPSGVLSVGVSIGVMSAVVKATGHQLISAMDPGKLAVAELGMLISSMCPLAVFTALEFKPSASDHEFRLVLVPLILINVMSMSVILGLHLGMYFEVAYVNLAYDLAVLDEETSDEEVEAARQRSRQSSRDRQLSDSLLPDEPIGFERHLSEMSRKSGEEGDSARSRNLPRWVWIWLAVKCADTTLQGCLSSLNSFFGGPALVQHMAMVRLASEVAGRASALPICRFHATCQNIWHWFPAIALGLEGVAAGVIFAKLWGWPCTELMLAVTWAVFNWMHRLWGTFCDVTVAQNVAIKDRKSLSRIVLFVCFGSLMLGFALAWWMVAPWLQEQPPSSVAVFLTHGYVTVVSRAGAGMRRGLRPGKLHVG